MKSYRYSFQVSAETAIFSKKVESFSWSIPVRNRRGKKRVIHVPGHSPGSVAFLTGEGDLICGDLFENRTKPRLYFVDDEPAVKKSLEKLKGYSIRYLYPGHGERFPFSEVVDLKNGSSREA